MKKIELINDFHNTSCAVRAKQALNGLLWLTSGQVLRAQRKLCPRWRECSCGDIAGARPQQVEAAVLYSGLPKEAAGVLIISGQP